MLKKRGPLVLATLIAVFGCDILPMSPAESAALRQLASTAAAVAPVYDMRLAPTMTETEAVTLATAFVRTLGEYYREQLERQHGSAIDFETLTAGPSVLFAETPYVASSVPVPAHIRNALGSYYMLTFHQGTEPAIHVAIAANATDLSVSDGRLVLPRHSGNEFRVFGLHPTNPWLPIGEEQAAIKAETASGRKAVGTPRFIARGLGFAPQLGYWRVMLDEPVMVRVKGAASNHVVDALYVSATGDVAAEIARSHRHEIRPRRGAKAVRLGIRPGIAADVAPVETII